MKFRNLIYNFLAFIYVFSFNLQNVKLFSQVGSISMIGEYYLMPISCLIYFFKRKECSNRISKIYKEYIIYFIIISVLMNIFFLIFLKKVEIYGKLFLVKSLHLLLHFIFQFISINALFYIFKQIKIKNIKWILNINFIFLVCYFIYERYFFKEIGRIKLLTSEPSIAGFLVSIIFFMMFYTNKKIIIRFFISCIFLIISYFIGSKGEILSILITLIIYGIINLKENVKTIIFSCIPIVSIFKLFFYENLVNSFLNDIEKFTSLVTRTWSIITTIVIALILPLGNSGVYLLTYSFFGERMKEFYLKLFPNLNYSEINFMLETGINLTPKSGIFFGILISGIGYVYMLIKIIKYLFNNLKQEKTLVLLIIYYFVSNLVYISDIQTPMQILIYPFLLCIVNRKRKELLI